MTFMSAPSTPQSQSTLRRHQIQLFCHLGQILCHLMARLPWHDISPAQMRRMQPLLASLQEGIAGAQQQMKRPGEPIPKVVRRMPLRSDGKTTQQQKPLP
jgi:hypothetical protein